MPTTAHGTADPAQVPDASAAPVRVLYVGGTPRSGSTLLDRVLSAVPMPQIDLRRSDAA